MVTVFSYHNVHSDGVVGIFEVRRHNQGRDHIIYTSKGSVSSQSVGAFYSMNNEQGVRKYKIIVYVHKTVFKKKLYEFLDLFDVDGSANYRRS